MLDTLIPKNFASSAVLLGVGGGFLAAAWGKIKVLLNRIWSVVFVTIEMEGCMATASKAYCWNNFRRSPFGKRRYGSDSAYVRPVDRFQMIGYEVMSTDPILFWNGWKPMLVSVPTTGGGGSPQQTLDGKGVITFLRGTFNADRFLNTCLSAYNDKFMGAPATETTEATNRQRFYIRRFVGHGGRKRNMESGGKEMLTTGGDSPVSNGGNITMQMETGELRVLNWKHGEIGPKITPNENALDALALPPCVEEMVLEIKRWLSSKKWYLDKRIPWTRGWTIYGPPGTGKTSLVRAMGQDFGLPIFVYDIASMSNNEFVQYWQQMQNSTPCIALIEDLDAVFEGRNNITGENGGGLTFDCFLNMLSGVDGSDGIFKVFTTNRIDVLDDALGVPRDGSGGEGTISTRPGRADRALELSFMTEKARLSLAKRILNDCPQFIDSTVEAGDGDTGAQFQERCAKIALVEHWKSFDLERAAARQMETVVKELPAAEELMPLCSEPA